MSIRIDSITIRNPSLKRAYSPSTMALYFSPPSSQGFEFLHRLDNYYKMSIVPRFVQPRGLGLNLLPLRGGIFGNVQFCRSPLHKRNRLGFLVDFLSHAAIVGFMGCTAIVMGLQQLKGLLGISNFTTKTDVVSVMETVLKALHHSVLFGSKVTMAVQDPSYPMDRASILGDAIDYLKELLQRIDDIHNELLRMH